MTNVSQILSRIEAGDASAAEQLLPLVYDELRKLAAAKLAHEKPGQTLQPTALVHEAYLRLLEPGKPPPGAETEIADSADVVSRSECGGRFNSRGHFFAAAAEAMRRILVESARRKHRIRHGGQWQRLELDEGREPTVEAASVDLLALDESLARLESADPLAAKVVKLRYFSGLTMPEVAAALDISLRTAERNWTYAKTWLHRDLR
jgi:RNA polymerase sigma factor (sigma-70 family)